MAGHLALTQEIEVRPLALQLAPCWLVYRTSTAAHFGDSSNGKTSGLEPANQSSTL